MTWRYFPLGFLLIMPFIVPVKSTISCNSFPKIFGGSSSSTIPAHIDVFNDYLALVGHTYDNSLTGISTTFYMPFIALTSISIGAK
jgi:hypothetical protein